MQATVPARHEERQPLDLDSPAYYINRELSWLEFNHRVLEEALDESAPLLERLKFLAIVSSNLDEFFMVRVAGLKRQGTSATVQRGPDGLTTDQQLTAIADRCHGMVQAQYRCFRDVVRPGLAEHGIRHLSMEELDADQARWVKSYFHRQVFPVLTPLAIDPGHPFPHLRNRSLNLIVTLSRSGQARASGARKPELLAVVQAPSVIPRVLRVPGPGHPFVLLEDVIAQQMGELFRGLRVTGCYAFRITRDSDLNIDEDGAEDLLETIEQEVRRREWGDAVRLEVTSRIGETALQELLSSLGITESDTYRVDGPLNLADFMGLYRLPEFNHLRDPVHRAPVVRPLQGVKDLFAAIRKRDILLHHPFESFQSVVDFIEQAADDPNVLAIKQTLYRTNGDSSIVAALSRAAQNGKQVTALVELKARFDEANNILWARQLERAGVHVVYGLVGLKTHCKALLVVRREAGEERLRRYVHLATGNYNESTAKLYTDLGLLTCNLEIGQDISRLFNLLTGFSGFPRWRKIAVAPIGLRERFIAMIRREAAHAAKGRPARVIAQMNSLVDPEVIRALYEASQAGVKIDLIVRGICCLRAKIKGVSDNIRVMSIVGRFLEHSRIYYFHNNGKEEIYLCSGDWMPRNLSRRVEVMFPVDDPALRRKVYEGVLLLRLRDNSRARALRSTGRYVRVRPRKGQPLIDSQALLLQQALVEHPPRSEERHATLLAFGQDWDAEEPGDSPVEGLTLGEQFPQRGVPPLLPLNGHPPDPQRPELEITGHAAEPAADALGDASGL